jgi:hypothetical protein
MTFIPAILSLVKVSQDVLEALEKEDMEYDETVAKAVQDCKALIILVSKTEKKKERFVKKFVPFFEKNFEALSSPYYIKDGDDIISDVGFYGAGNNARIDGVFRGICLVPHEKNASICIPFSELLELAICLGECNSTEYGMFVPRLVYTLLSAMTCLDSEEYVTDDIDIVMASLESDAQIEHNGLGAMIDGLPGLNINANSAQNIMAEFAGSDKLNEIVGAVGGIMDKVKGGNFAEILGAFTGKGSGEPELDTDPDEQE